jgi:hypothetical protein
MRKLLTLVLAISFALTLNHGAAHAKEPLDRACRFQYLDGHVHWSVKEVKLTITCAVKRWPVSLDTALYIADRESGFHQFAYNPSGCSGVYQWAGGTWASVLGDFPPLYKRLGHSVWNARSNVMYAVKYAHNRGWSPWGM